MVFLNLEILNFELFWVFWRIFEKYRNMEKIWIGEKNIFYVFYVQELPNLVSLNEVTKHEKSKKSQEEGEEGGDKKYASGLRC